MKRILLLGSNLLLLLAPMVASGATVTQLWPEIDVYYRLNQGARLYFLISPVREVNDGQRSEITDTHWNRTRFQLGTAVSVTKWFAPEVYWAHQLDDASDGETTTDALGIVAAFFF